MVARQTKMNQGTCFPLKIRMVHNSNSKETPGSAMPSGFLEVSFPTISCIALPG